MSKVFVAGGIAVALSSVAVASLAPASALATSGCTGGGTLVSAGICEIKFTSGTHTFTPPTGITKLHALVVGAGGAGDASGVNASSYGGGGGDVKLVTLSASGNVTVVVGAAGVQGTPTSASNSSSVTQAGVTTTAAGGGNASDSSGWSGSSGNGNAGNSGRCGVWFCVGGGAGAGGSANTTSLALIAQGGPGLIVNTLAGANLTLFAADTKCYGGGGSASSISYNGTVWSHQNAPSVCGGGSGTFAVAGDGSYVSYSQSTPLANSGSGGATLKYQNASTPAANVRVGQAGAAGVVILRYDEIVLPNTGSDSGLNTTIGALALGAVLTGLGVLLMSRRQSRA